GVGRLLVLGWRERHERWDSVVCAPQLSLRRGRDVRLPLLVCDGAPEAEPAGHGLVVDRPDGRVGVGAVGADMAGRGRVLDAVGGDAPPDRVHGAGPADPHRGVLEGATRHVGCGAGDPVPANRVDPGVLADDVGAAASCEVLTPGTGSVIYQ